MKNNLFDFGKKSSVITLTVAVLFGLQYAIAQTEEATSSPSIEKIDTSTTTTEVVGEDKGNPLSPEDEPEATSKTQSEQTTVIAAKDAAITEITTLEDNYFQKAGKYLQILKANGLPDYESGNVATKLGRNISDKAYVHVYESAEGKGYQVFYEDGDMLYSIGYGPEAADRTFERSTAVPTSATSTQAVVQ